MSSQKATLRARIATALTALEKSELEALLLDSAERYNEVESFLALRLLPTDHRMQPALDQLRRDIKATAVDPSWHSEESAPDYSSIEMSLSVLLERGCYEQVIELGELLLNEAIEHIEHSYDQGETQIEIAESIAILFQAIARSERTNVERMLWLWDLQLQDEYCLLDDIRVKPVDEETLTADEWRQLAQHYEMRLQAATPKETQLSRGTKEHQTDWSAKYRRSALLRYATRAWSSAQEPEQVTRLLLQSLTETDCYPQLVDHLCLQGALYEAKEWAERGIQQTQDESPGIARGLKEKLPKIAELSGNKVLAEAYYVAFFIDSPSVSNWTTIKTRALESERWPAISEALLAWLKSGEDPAQRDNWPLPDPKLPLNTSNKTPGRQSVRHFPRHTDLISIALNEQQIDDAVFWYQQQPAPKAHSLTLADAAKEQYPALSLQIWQQHIESLIAEVKPKSYLAAKPFLIKIRGLMQAMNRHSEFVVLVNKLRLEHKAKRRLMEVLAEVLP